MGDVPFVSLGTEVDRIWEVASATPRPEPLNKQLQPSRGERIFTQKGEKRHEIQLKVIPAA